MLSFGQGGFYGFKASADASKKIFILKTCGCIGDIPCTIVLNV